MKKIISLLAISSLILGGCSSTPSGETNALKITTSFYPLALIAEEIGGDYVSVESIYPEDSDPHSYELTSQQSVALSESDLVIVADEHEDEAVYNAANAAGVPVISVTDETEFIDQVPTTEEHEHEDEEHEHGELNAHVWTTPKNAAIIANIITEKLTELDQENQTDYVANNDNLQESLTALDGEYQLFADQQTKTFVVTHDAYAYLASEYGIDYVTLYGEHHDDEPTTKDITNVVDLINEQEISTIFVEQNDANNEVMKQISDETGASVETFYNLATPSSTKQFSSITELYEYNLQMLELGDE